MAANANNYTLALSPTAINNAIGMPRSTYNDQFKKLVQKGYLVPSHGNTYHFYEVPQSATQLQNSMSVNGQAFAECPSHDKQEASGDPPKPSEHTEINNIDNTINNSEINNRSDSSAQKIQKPAIKEIVIQRPKAEGKNRPSYNPKLKAGEFVF